MPGQSKTASVIIAPPKEAANASPTAVAIGGPAFLSACEYKILRLEIPIVLFAWIKSSFKMFIKKYLTIYAQAPNETIINVISGKAI